MKIFLLSLSCLSFMSCLTGHTAPGKGSDPDAERMLLYQRDNGGWPQYGGDVTDYSIPLTPETEAMVRADKAEEDATLDDHTTTREIRYLVEAFGETKNPTYRDAAVAGMEYLFRAQYPSGGWPQQYPDTSSYHGHITFNDKAMMDVMNLFFDATRGEGAFASLDTELRGRADAAVQRGISCILNTQYVDTTGRLTVWGAQHDRTTLLPAPARKFEPASLSGSESAGIVRFLMDIPEPGERVRQSVRAAVRFLDSVSIEGYRVDEIEDSDQPSGRDRVVVPDGESTLWARFYELETFQPIFTGRDAVVQYELSDIENERRVGYTFYGTWPDKVIHKEYPKWEKSLEP